MSETTKRIENILGMYLFCEDNPPKGLVKELATHLHQEVVRHEIDVLKREMTWENEFRFKTLIKDLERQIEETPDER